MGSMVRLAVHTAKDSVHLGACCRRIERQLYVHQLCSDKLFYPMLAPMMVLGCVRVYICLTFCLSLLDPEILWSSARASGPAGCSIAIVACAFQILPSPLCYCCVRFSDAHGKIISSWIHAYVRWAVKGCGNAGGALQLAADIRLVHRALHTALTDGRRQTRILYLRSRSS